MISKSRLKELIEQGAIIYQVYADVSVIKIKLDKDFKVNNSHLWKKLKGAVKSCGYPLYKLFETKEEAEWYREFGCIERTERLELPTWEEIQKCSLYTLYFNNKELYLYRVYFNREAEMITIEEQNEEYLECFTEIENLKFTKENYILACRKAKELFLGEKE